MLKPCHLNEGELSLSLVQERRRKTYLAVLRLGVGQLGWASDHLHRQRYLWAPHGIIFLHTSNRLDALRYHVGIDVG